MKNVETKINVTISTVKAEKCLPKEVEESRLLFNNNPIVKNMFKNNINTVLEVVFHSYFYEKDCYSPGESYGIYDFEMSGRSVINKLNTNYSCFSVLVRDVNKVLLSENQPLLCFTNLSQNEQINQVKRLNNVINEFKFRIFDINSKTFQSLMMVLNQTHNWGQKREDNTIVLLKKQFGEQNVKPIGKLGSTQDMVGGIDTIITINGSEITAQIKPFTHLIGEQNLTFVMGAGNVKKYKTDWLIFSKNDKEILVFDNKNSKIVDGNFVFNKENLIYTLS